jgi:hypothetical protein
MYIKNVKGSSKVSSKPKEGDSWREFWEIKSGITIGSEFICPACGRKVKIEHVDGCHVQKSRSTDECWYIVPLCDSCNRKTGEVGIPDTMKLVPVV